MPSYFRMYGVNPIRIRIHSAVLFLLGVVQGCCTWFLGEIQRSVFTLREPNVTNIELKMYSNIPFEDCQCSAALIETCYTNEILKYTRIVPLIIFLLEIYLFKYVFSLHQNPRCFFAILYWIVSIFLFFSLLTIIYQSSYYYHIITRLLVVIGWHVASYGYVSYVTP